MPKTISELEAQRAKILQEIESKAGNLSSGSGDKKPSLNDWLNAAEEVMPETDQGSTAENANYSTKLLKTSHSNTSSTPFFTVIIILTLFLTLVGLMYIGYMTLNNELKSAVSYKEQSTQQINELQEGMTSLQQSLATGGKSELFVQMESEVATLKAKITELEAKLAEQTAKGSSDSLPTAKAGADSNKDSAQLITESVLEGKLKLYNDQLEKNLDDKIQKVIQELNGSEKKTASLTSELAAIKESASAEKVDSVDVPTVKTAVSPRVEEPKIATVDKVDQPAQPKIPEAPKAMMTADVKWLIEQPKKNYILQLASMPTEESVKQVMQKKGIDDGKIIPQVRNAVVSYILVVGSLKEKTQAQKLAKEIKNKTGISPWIRQIEDISRRVE